MDVSASRGRDGGMMGGKDKGKRPKIHLGSEPVCLETRSPGLKDLLLRPIELKKEPFSIEVPRTFWMFYEHRAPNPDTEEHEKPKRKERGFPRSSTSRGVVGEKGTSVTRRRK